MGGQFGKSVKGSRIPGHDEQRVKDLDGVQLEYWPLFAKNLATMIALDVAKVEWSMAPGPGDKGGDLWTEWLEMKPATQWGYLPNLILPDGKRLGSELAILQYLAHKCPLLEGQDDTEFRISQELLHQSEELFQKLLKKCPTILKDADKDVFNEFWTGTDAATHSAEQGLQVYLAQFQEFYVKENCEDGSFTKKWIHHR